MRVTAEDIVALTGFPLLWRWTQESHAKFAREDLASIRPIHPAKAATIWAQTVSSRVGPIRAEDRIDANGAADSLAVGKWLEDRVPVGEREVLLSWDRQTAVVVPRRLFIDRWDDFWYPSSDDLSVMGIVGTWRIEMYHYGMFDFDVGGAVEQAVAADGAAPRR